MLIQIYVSLGHNGLIYRLLYHSQFVSYQDEVILFWRHPFICWISVRKQEYLSAFCIFLNTVMTLLAETLALADKDQFELSY